MGLHYHTFMGRNLGNNKKPTSVSIINSETIVNNIGFLND